MIKRQRHKKKYTPEYYLEAIILKLDRIEAELEVIKPIIYRNTNETTLISEKIKKL